MRYLAGLGASYDRRPPTNPGAYPGCVTAAQKAAARAACKPIELRGLGLLSFDSANPCWVESLPLCPTTTAPVMRNPKPVVDWVKLAEYARAVQAADAKRTQDLLTYAAALKTAKDRQDLLTYAAALKAANDRRAQDLLTYAAAVKAEQTKPPALRTAPPRPPAPPPPPPKPPALTTPRVDVPPPPTQEPPPAPPSAAPPEVSEPVEADTPPPVGSLSTGGLLALVAAVGAGAYLVLRKRPA